MLKLNLLFILILFLHSFGVNSQGKQSSQSKIELSFQIGYSRPMLEAYGNKVTINATEDQVFIDGKRLLISDNLGTNTGYTVQTYLKYNFFKRGYVKGLMNIGYNIVYGIYPGPSGYEIGVRVQTFSLGTGIEANPIGHDKRLYPGVYGLLRLNLVGGESFHKAGLDFFKVKPRYGYTAGIKLNYSLKKTIGLYAGYSYTYDNLWDKQTEESTPTDAHVIVFRDKASSTNELTHDRRLVYWSLYLGMNFFFN